MSFERKLIAEVKKYECLYNMQALSYKDVAFKDKLWQKVAQKCESNVEECKKKWKHLRDCYNRCKKRDMLLPKAALTDGVKRKVWRYMTQLEFLNPFFNQKIALLNREALDYDSSEEFESPPSVQALDESKKLAEVTKIEAITKIDEMYLDNERMDNESLNALDSEEVDALSVEAMFPNFIETTIPAIPSMSHLREEDDSTTLMFRLLDRKIKQASLTEAQISELETSVMMLVYNKLSEYKN